MRCPYCQRPWMPSNFKVIVSCVRITLCPHCAKEFREMTLATSQFHASLADQVKAERAALLKCRFSYQKLVDYAERLIPHITNMELPEGEESAPEHLRS